MGLELHGHPLSSFCWKVLIALYEKELPFEAVTVDLGDPGARAEFQKLSPFGKIPALRDGDRGAVVYETSIIIDYLDQHHPGAVRLIPEHAEAAREARLRDRMFDLHLHEPMQRVVADRLRPAESRDPLGVEQARGRILAAYEVIERDLEGRTWRRGRRSPWPTARPFRRSSMPTCWSRSGRDGRERRPTSLACARGRAWRARLGRRSRSSAISRGPRPSALGCPAEARSRS